MSKTLIVKINSRKVSSEKLENSIIQALESCGIECDGTDTSFDGELNRNIFFLLPKNIDFEVIEDDFLDDEEI